MTSALPEERTVQSWGWGENDWGQATAPNDLSNVELPYAVTGDLNTQAVGTYTVTYTATNIVGEVGTNSRTVVVIDTTPPEVNCPTNIIVDMTQTDGAVVQFSPQGTDLCSGTVLVSSTPASGSTFPAGTNIVICSAVDSSGNSNQCAFTVTVRDLYSAKTNILAEMNAANSARVPLLGRAIDSLAEVGNHGMVDRRAAFNF